MITAAIPTYNNSPILWLQLESLCRQIEAPEWELIMCEEESENYFGADRLAEYTERLKAANCVSIKYLKLSNWIPLGQKWLTIRENMHSESVGMMLCASDNYSPSDRIRKSYDAMIDGYEWSQFNQGYFYNIIDHEAGLFNAGKGNPALFMCICTKSLAKVRTKLLPRKGVDTWLMKASGVQKVLDLGFAGGCHTDGYNTLSLGRKNIYKLDESGQFKKADADKVLSTFPKDIQERLIQMR